MIAKLCLLINENIIRNGEKYSTISCKNGRLRQVDPDKKIIDKALRSWKNSPSVWSLHSIEFCQCTLSTRVKMTSTSSVIATSMPSSPSNPTLLPNVQLRWEPRTSEHSAPGNWTTTLQLWADVDWSFHEYDSIWGVFTGLLVTDRINRSWYDQVFVVQVQNPRLLMRSSWVH